MKTSFAKELLSMRAKHPMVKRIRCSAEEEKILAKLSREKFDELPNPVVIREEWEHGIRTDAFYKIEEDGDISDSERIEYIMLKQETHLDSIRKILCFFVALTCITIAIGVAAIVIPLL